MKKTLFFLALAVCPLAQGAVSVTGTNLVLGPTTLVDSMLVTDNAGNPLPGLAWAAGAFDVEPTAATDLATIKTTFMQNGSDGVWAATAGVFGALGATPITDAATSIDSTDNFTGKAVYIMISDANTIAGANEVILFKTTETWPQEVQGVGAAFGVNVAQAWRADPLNLVRGGVTVVQGAVGPTAAQNGNAGVTFVPEPSTSLLAGLAGLALLIRRKR